MKSPALRPIKLLLLSLTLVLADSAQASSVIVNVTFLPSLAGNFLYSISITNNGPEDLAVISLTSGPSMDALITPSIAAPAGFSATYDGALGVVDLLEDTSSFTTGGTVGMFTFESMAPPNTFFATFEALDVNGGSVSGTPTVIPEPASTAFAALALLPIALRRRRVA